MKKVVLITIYEMPNTVSRFREGKIANKGWKYVTRKQETTRLQGSR